MEPFCLFCPDDDCEHVEAMREWMSDLAEVIDLDEYRQRKERSSK